MQVDLQEIMDEATKDITERLTGIHLKRTEGSLEKTDHLCSLSVDVDGQYRMVLAYHAEDQLLRMIAEKMKRGPVENEEEMVIYLKEYFNVLCGHIVSKFNREVKASARFGIPDFVKGVYTVDTDCGQVFEVCYQSIAGQSRIWSTCEKKQTETSVLKQKEEEYGKTNNDCR